MTNPNHQTLLFQQANFVTHLPLAYRYTRSHFWAKVRGEGRVRAGFTRFATRMLGEMVDHNFEVQKGVAVVPGQVLGWVEGFKAISEVACVGEGRFAGGNPALNENIGLLNQAPYQEGWLYEIDGVLAEQSLDANGYAEHLRVTIEKFLQDRKTGGTGPAGQGR